MNYQTLENHLRDTIPEIRVFLVKEPGLDPPAIGCPNDLEKYLAPLRNYSEEYFIAFHLNIKHRISGYHIVAKGTATESIVHPREIFKAAILNNSFCIIVAHNHPAGSLNPSKEDILMTKVLIKAGAVMGVNILDHVIISVDGINSLRENHREIWPQARLAS